MGIIRQIDLVAELEPWIGVQKPAETPAPSRLDAAWAKASAVAATVDTAAAAFGGLDKAANDLTDGTAHPSEWTRRFDEAVGNLPVDGLPDEDFADFQALAQMRGTRLKVDAVRRQHEDIATRFEDALDGYVQKAADAPSNAIEATFRNQAMRAIERIDQAGLLGPGVADRLRAELPARIDRALALRVIERDPAHAAALLTQPGALPALDDAERQRLARKAGSRAERQGHEKALADERHRAGTVAELWSQLGTLDDADIDSAEADGRLRASEAQDFRQRLQVDRDARRQRTDAIARVNDVLAGEGALDPSSPEDRKAVDAHFAETERGWDDNQVAAELRPGQIGAYVGRTGILPPALARRIGAAFRAGDANRQNEVADIVAAIGQSPGRKVLVGLPVEDLLPSILILSLRENGLDPDAAAARAGAIVSGDAQARDHNFQRDLAAAGRWAEESGSFDNEQLGTLRERLSELVVPGSRHPPAVDLRGSRTMELRRSRDEPEVTDLLHRPAEDGPDAVALMAEQGGKASEAEPAIAAPDNAGQAGGDAKPGTESATPAAAPADPPYFAPTNLPMEPERKTEMLDRLDRLAPDEIPRLDHRTRVDLLKAIATDNDLMRRHRETARRLMAGIKPDELRSDHEKSLAKRTGEAIAADPDIARILTRKQWSRATAEEREDVLRRIVAHHSRIYGYPPPAVEFRNLGPEERGRNDQATNTIRINSFLDRYKESPEDVIATTLEEATHLWQWRKLKSYAENTMSPDDPDRPLAETLAASHPFYQEGSVNPDAYAEHPSERHAKEVRQEILKPILNIISDYRAPTRTRD